MIEGKYIKLETHRRMTSSGDFGSFYTTIYIISADRQSYNKLKSDQNCLEVFELLDDCSIVLLKLNTIDQAVKVIRSFCKDNKIEFLTNVLV